MTALEGGRAGSAAARSGVRQEEQALLSKSSRAEGQRRERQKQTRGTEQLLPHASNPAKCRYRQHNGAIETGE